MELHRLSDPIHDPFLDAVRRRHPDVDVVVLPPEPPPGDAPPPLTDDVVAATLVSVATLARQLWGSVAPDSEEVPEARYVYGAGPGAVRATSRVVTRRDDGFHVLVALRHELETDGWEVVRPPGVVERLEARLDDLLVTASYAEESGALVVAVASESMSVGQPRARELTRPQEGGR